MRCYYACVKNGAHTKWQKFGFKIIMLETLVKHDCFASTRNQNTQGLDNNTHQNKSPNFNIDDWGYCLQIIR